LRKSAISPTKRQQWAAFVEEVTVNLIRVVDAFASFLLPHAEKARNLYRENVAGNPRR
jgi:hypothetical protein